MGPLHFSDEHFAEKVEEKVKTDLDSKPSEPPNYTEQRTLHAVLFDGIGTALAAVLLVIR